MNEDIFSILNSENSGKALLILYKQNIELNTYEKVLLANHWVKSGSPEHLEPALIGMLGLEWEDYLNPFLHKLMTYKLETLALRHPVEFNSLSDDKYAKLLESIFHKKLKELEKSKTDRGYESTRNYLTNTEGRNLLTYSITSKTTKFDLVRVELDAIGYNYDVRVYLMETGINLGDLLTDQSITNLKGLMYFMSEEDKWDVSQIDRSINFIEFKPQILNTLIRAMRTLYDRKDETGNESK